MLLRRLYKRIVLLLRLAHGIFQITLLERRKEEKRNIKSLIQHFIKRKITLDPILFLYSRNGTSDYYP